LSDQLFKKKKAAELKRHEKLRYIRRLLIVCEGEKTEPNYFKKFPVDKEIMEIYIEGEGYNTDSLVEKAIELKDQAIKKKEPYNEVWCVFDRDNFPK